MDTRIKDYFNNIKQATLEDAKQSAEEMYERAVRSIFPQTEPTSVQKVSKSVQKVMGRPKLDLPVDRIKELAKRGVSCRRIANILIQEGYKVSKSSVQKVLSQSPSTTQNGS